MKLSLATLVCLFFILPEACNAQSPVYEPLEMSYNVISIDGLGPVIEISCRLVPSPGERIIYFIWHRVWYTGSTIKFAEHGVLLGEAPTRFTLNVVDNYTEKLSIRNALREDYGLSEDSETYVEFQCNVAFTTAEGGRVLGVSIPIPVDKYLPALHYPICNVTVQSVLSSSEIEFTCSRGDSNPEVNLCLRLRRPDGSVRQLGTTNVTTSVFSDDNNAYFMCEMKSDAFPTANRSCRARPLNVLPTLIEGTIISQPSSIADNKSPMTTNNPSVIEEAAQGTCILHVILIILLAFVALLAILTNVYLLIKNKKLKKKLLAMHNKKTGVDGPEPYMELQKTQTPPGSQDYMDLQQTHKENPGANLCGYEKVKKGNENLVTYDSPYESVE